MYMRDVRKPLELSVTDLQSLIRKLEKITNTKFNDKFSDQINNFIGILREKFLIDQTIPNHKKMKREFVKLKSSLNKISDMDLGHHVQMLLYASMPGGIGKFSEACDNIETLSQACDIAIDDLKQREKQKEHTFTATKQAMATELARELDSFGVKITSYRDGVFENSLREFFTAFNGQASGKDFNIYVAEDLFKIIRKAKKDYTNTERFILLRFR